MGTDNILTPDSFFRIIDKRKQDAPIKLPSGTELEARSECDRSARLFWEEVFNQSLAESTHAGSIKKRIAMSAQFADLALIVWKKRFEDE